MPPRESVVHEGRSPYETEAQYRARTGKKAGGWTRERVPVTDARLRNSRLRAPRPVDKNGVVKTANFEPKRVRKAKRKALIRGYLGNVALDVRSEFADRAEFYRNLRFMKVKRRMIAKEMRRLDMLVTEMTGAVRHLENRYPDFHSSALDETQELCRAARVAVSVAADEWQAFAARRVLYYVKGI